MALSGTIGGDPVRALRFAKAARHSRLVRRLRWLLPTAAVAALVAFIGAGWVASLVEGITLGPIQLQGTSLVMANPRLTGFDAARRPYELTAERARQDIRDPRKIELERLDARSELAANGWVRVTADQGFYDSEAETFRAQGNVHLTSSLGYEGFLQEAFVNTRQQSMASDKPVEVRQGANRILADSMRVTNSGEVVVFEGNVRSTFHPREDSR